MFKKIRQGIPQYNDFRHKMSRKSAHHRVKRNQQMIEAQRLLESHTMSKNSNEFEKKFSGGRDRDDEICDRFESHQQGRYIRKNENSLQVNFENGRKDRTALNLPSDKDCRESGKAATGTSSIQSENSKKRHTKLFHDSELDAAGYSTKEVIGESGRGKETICKHKMYED